MAAPPLLIWTLQRTGGTNLTRQLAERSGWPILEHEPFNVGRVHGNVAQEFRANGDVAQLDARMRDICAQPAVIKHCVEMVPWAVTEALARASVEAGFRHLVLFRRSALDRLLSRQFALLSGIWGPKMRPSAAQEAVFAHGLPVKDMLAHEARCVQLLRNTWSLLLELGQAPFPLAFEDIYAAPEEQARLKLRQLLAAMSMQTQRSADDRLIGDVLRKGDQGTRAAYAGFPGVAELETALARLAPFEPAVVRLGAQAIRPAPGASPWVAHASLDTPGPLVGRHEVRLLSGLVVLAAKAPPATELLLRTSSGLFKAPWGFRSDWAKQHFPGSPNAALARFSVEAQPMDTPLEIVVREPLNDRVQVALKLTLQPREA